MLKIIRDSLEELVGQQRQHLSDIERLHYFREHHKPEEFSRKDYMNLFRHISTATATRDLRKGVEMGLLKREGENRLARYQFIS
jgi:Fic family protein